MNGTIQKWGNSHAVRLPKAVLSAARFQENDLVAFSAEENRIVITKLCRRHRTLKERLASAPVQPQAGSIPPRNASSPFSHASALFVMFSAVALSCSSSGNISHPAKMFAIA